MENKAKEYITTLNLLTHPEGGYFREIYKSEDTFQLASLPRYHNGARSYCTLIYYLLEEKQKSNFHILKSDEIWHHLDGSTIELHMIDRNGEYNKISLGKDLSSGCVLQFVIPRDTWFAAGLQDAGSFVLVGCTVVPGFEFEDFKLANRDELLTLFPSHKFIIEKFTTG
jgi:hypothetical protein